MPDQPVGYQLRHCTYGVFQGELMGMGFWHPSSDMPEQGILEFRTYEEVSAYRAFLCSRECRFPMRMSWLTIEPYDRETSLEMQRR